MSYVAKTDWKGNDPVTEGDINRWEFGIQAAHEELKQKVDDSERGVAEGIATLGTDGKVTPFQLEDASITKKGQVQLSNAIDSTSEILAATPKAVKTVADQVAQNSTKTEILSDKTDDLKTAKTNKDANGILQQSRIGASRMTLCLQHLFCPAEPVQVIQREPSHTMKQMGRLYARRSSSRSHMMRTVRSYWRCKMLDIRDHGGSYGGGGVQKNTIVPAGKFTFTDIAESLFKRSTTSTSTSIYTFSLNKITNEVYALSKNERKIYVLDAITGDIKKNFIVSTTNPVNAVFNQITVSDNGRLYIGFYSTFAYVAEINPNTGAIIKQVGLSSNDRIWLMEIINGQVHVGHWTGTIDIFDLD